MGLLPVGGEMGVVIPHRNVGGKPDTSPLNKGNSNLRTQSIQMRILPGHLRSPEMFYNSLTISPMLMGLPTWVNVSRPGGISDASRMELLQSNHTRSRESILKLRDMRHILVFLNSTSLTCATMLSQHRCTCDGNTLPRSGAVDRMATVH